MGYAITITIRSSSTIAITSCLVGIGVVGATGTNGASFSWGMISAIGCLGRTGVEGLGMAALGYAAFTSAFLAAGDGAGELSYLWGGGDRGNDAGWWTSALQSVDLI